VGTVGSAADVVDTAAMGSGSEDTAGMVDTAGMAVVVQVSERASV
jgi:hypothetical protein